MLISFPTAKVLNTVVTEPEDPKLLISKPDTENDPELIPSTPNLKNILSKIHPNVLPLFLLQWKF
jgi:hypothetical protein